MTDTKTKNSEIKISETAFPLVVNNAALKQYIHVYLTNQRQGTSSTKTRGEVSGGGKKPWSQKGTGRARQGSTRSPIWVHGGTAFGPKPKDWSININNALRVSAFKSAMAYKIINGNLYIVDAPVMEKPSTKQMETFILKITDQKPVLLVWKDTDDFVKKSVTNLQNVEAVHVTTLNAYQLVSSKAVIIFKDALAFLENKYENK